MVSGFRRQPFESPPNDGASALPRAPANALELREQLAVEAERYFGFSRHWYECVIPLVGRQRRRVARQGAL